jgi:hypothetical protein
MTQPWEDFGAIGATTSSGSGHSRALSVDSALGILPFPYALGSDNPKAACFRIRGLVGTRAAYIQSILRDAGRRYPLSGSHTQDYFMASGFLNGVTVVRVWRPSQDLMRRIVHGLTTLDPVPVPRFVLSLDDAPRMITYTEWTHCHIDQVINGIRLDTWTAYCDFMASPVVDMGDAGIVAHFELIRTRLQANPYTTNIYYLM